jgi:CxxC motif-containing protein
VKEDGFKLICIMCPRGCPLVVSGEPPSLIVMGHQCPKGEAYALQEITSPMRTLTSTVRTVFPDFPMLPVRTSGDIPLSEVFAVMRRLRTVTVERRLGIGDVVIPSGWDGVDVIATADMNENRAADREAFERLGLLGGHE